MRVTKKEGIEKVKFEHNKVLFWIIIGLMIILICISCTIIYLKNQKESCVPSTCCHAKSCVNIKDASDCSGVSCTADCVEGTLDCGQGECVYENGECKTSLK